MNTCATDVGTRFLAGLLTESESRAFEEHLESCQRCLNQLEFEAGGVEAWESARELLIHQVPNTTDWVSSAPSVPEGLPQDSEWLPACTSSVVLSILSPSDDPEYVGRIGSYEVSGIVGRGSAGIVLRGFDRALHRNVAIKILDPAIAGVGAARQRFGREARAMAAISHEHVVPVYEVNEHAGLPYFVMEYVPGGSLERRLRAHGPFDVESVIRIGLQTAKGLAAAHANGLVHRDIKPGNILLDRGTERVRVADFGLVRVANDVSCTRSGFIAGTPQYMAPEQVRAEICDGRSDLFSLGSLMYALCTGHVPFRAESVYAVMQRIVHDSPRSIRESNPTVPDWLEEFILKLMSKDRADRFSTAEEVANILQGELAVLQNPDLAQRRHWQPKRRVVRRSRARFVAAIVVGSLAIAGLGISLHGTSDQNRQVRTTGSSVTEITAEQPSVSADPTPVIAVWDEEEIDATKHAFSRMNDELHEYSATIPIDLWEEQVNELRQHLLEVANELERTSSTDPIQISP